MTKKPVFSLLVILGTALGVNPVHAIAQESNTFTVYASGLNEPRGLKFGPDGLLYVAEAGTGGTTGTVGSCQQVPAPVGPYTGGKTARISKITENGTLTTVAAGFPSALDATKAAQGVADVAFVGNSLYALISGGGCSHGNPDSPNGVASVDRATGQWNLIANLSTFVQSHPTKFKNAGDFEPDGDFYSMITVGNALYAVEANHGQLLAIRPGGQITQVVDISASEGHVVPTSIAELRGSFYVGMLNQYPIEPNFARVLTVSRGIDYDPAPGFQSDWRALRIIGSKAGFTTVVAVDFGPDGLLYALELSAGAGFPSPGAGKVVRVNRSGNVEDVVTGLSFPTGMTFGPDHRLYISNFGVGAPGSGQIVRVDVSPAS